MAQTADGAAGFVRGDHPSAEVGLVKALLHYPFGIAALRSVRTAEAQEANRLVEREQELALVDQVLDDIHRGVGHVDAVADLAEQDDWQPQLERSAKLGIVAVDGALAIGVVEQTPFDFSVRVRSGGGARVASISRGFQIPRAASITRLPSPDRSETQDRSARVTKPPFLLARVITEVMIELRSGSAVDTRLSYHATANPRRLESTDATAPMVAPLCTLQSLCT